MQTCSIKLNYLSNYARVFLYKSSSRTKDNWLCIIGFLINAGLLNVYFILQSLLNCMPWVLKTCSGANVPCVLTCPRTNALCVLTCSRANAPCVLTCLRAHVPCVLTCSRANVSCILTCSRTNASCVLAYLRALRAYVLTCQRASCDATIFSFAAIVAEVVHTVGKV